MVWNTPALYKDLFVQYVNYVQYHYSSDFNNSCIIVFDGYSSDNLNIKFTEHQRRAKNINTQEVNVDPENMVKLSQASFLAVSSNKVKLISLLQKHFVNAGIVVKLADSDADYMIAVTAAKQAEDTQQASVIVVGQDNDLAVLLIEHCKTQNLFMMRPCIGGKMEKITNIHGLQSKLNPLIVKNILFVYAMSGCDTTSAFYKKGKKSALTVLANNNNLSEELLQFKNCSVNVFNLLSSGEKFILKWSGSQRSQRFK